MHTIVWPLTVGTVVPEHAIAIEAVGAMTSVAVFLYVRYAPHTCQTKTDAGLYYMVLNAIVVALTQYLGDGPDHDRRWNICRGPPSSS